MRPRACAAESDTEGEEGEEGEEGGEEPLPDTVRRRCTDVPCLLAFLLGNAALGPVAHHAVSRGNLDRTTSFSSDYEGDPCGFGRNSADRYLLFCLRAPNGTGGQPALDTDAAVCVSRCPSSSNTSRDCHGVPVPDYPTREFMGMMCKPLDRNLTEQLRSWFQDHLEARLVIRFHTLRNTMLPLLGCGLLAIAVFLLYILFLSRCAGCLVWSVFALLSAVPLACAAYFLRCWRWGGCSDDPFGLAELGPHADLGVGLALLLVGLAFLGSACKRGDSIDLAVSCLEAASDCIVETGALRAVPVVALLLRVVVIAAAGVALMLLLSCGHQVDDAHATVLLQGLLVIRTVFGAREWLCLAVLGAMFFWDFHFVTSLTEFASMYLTELWFFTHDREGRGMPRCALLRAYWAALRYHCGTLSLGALVLGLTALPRHVLGFVAAQARTAHNPVTVLLGAVCCFCVGCFEHCLAPLCRDAYMDLCLSSRPFWEASRHALVLVRSEEEAVKILKSVTWLFQLGALLSVAQLGNALTLLAVSTCSAFADSRSPSYVYNRELAAIAGAIASSVAALPFMMIFDTVSDTIVYCYSVQKLRLRGRLRAAEAGRYCGCLAASFPCARPRDADGRGAQQAARGVAVATQPPGRPPGSALARKA